MITRRQLLSGLGASALGALSAKAGAAAPTAGPRVNTEARFPNFTLRSHDGRALRFYDDVLKGKVVAINMMYAECASVCPGMTANLVRVQKELGDLVGKFVFMYSITLAPEHDTPERLKEYAAMHHVRPGWLFLTGKRADIEAIRRGLGFYDSDPKVDADRSQHTGMVAIGNEPKNRWCMTPALGEPLQIANSILSIDRRRVRIPAEVV